VSIGTERHGKGIGIYLNKKVRLIIEDGDKTFPRDGILRDFDDYNYYLEMILGSKRGKTLAFLKTTVRRIEPIEDGGNIKWYS
jgi:hypothetical protein